MARTRHPKGLRLWLKLIKDERAKARMKLLKKNAQSKKVADKAPVLTKKGSRSLVIK